MTHCGNKWERMFEDCSSCSVRKNNTNVLSSSSDNDEKQPEPPAAPLAQTLKQKYGGTEQPAPVVPDLNTSVRKEEMQRGQFDPAISRSLSETIGIACRQMGAGL